MLGRRTFRPPGNLFLTLLWRVPSFRALLFGRGGGAGSELGKLKDGYFSSRFRKQR